MNYYRSHISTKNEEIYQQISKILNIEPTVFENEIKTL
jgi:hypothetical protein